MNRYHREAKKVFADLTPVSPAMFGTTPDGKSVIIAGHGGPDVMMVIHIDMAIERRRPRKP